MKHGLQIIWKESLRSWESCQIDAELFPRQSLKKALIHDGVTSYRLASRYFSSAIILTTISRLNSKDLQMSFSSDDGKSEWACTLSKVLQPIYYVGSDLLASTWKR